ncbi:MAG: redox-sensing transcriptional repressor Rex [Clostridia bacterium]|nr:redox-sensing transcriptional repressor Rex [Clostridia bacterium]
MQHSLSRATLERLPLYLSYLRKTDAQMISAARISREMHLGEVQVRKDFASVCPAGLPRVGYPVETLTSDIERALGLASPMRFVIVGAGKLGMALMEYDGFSDYGVQLIAAFDLQLPEPPLPPSHVPVYPMQSLAPFCRDHHVHAGILAVPAASAQSAADELIRGGVRAILSFSPVRLRVPEGVTVRRENIALSLACLHQTAGDA